MKWREMSWVGWLNRLLLQWFFVRLAYEVDDAGRKVNFGILRWVWPTTGWTTDYRWLRRVNPPDRPVPE